MKKLGELFILLALVLLISMMWFTLHQQMKVLEAEMFDIDVHNIYNNIDTRSDIQQLTQVLERFQMYEANINMDMYIGGIANRDNFYCVWTKNQTTEEIASTIEHEKCHVQVDRQYAHFCNVPHN